MKTHYQTKDKEIIDNLTHSFKIGVINTIFLCGAVIGFMPRVWPQFPTLLICSLILSLPLSNLLSLLHYRRFRNIDWVFLRFCIFDSLILTAILHYLGDLKTSLAFIYLVPIIMANPIFSLKRIFILLAIYASSYFGLIILEGLRIIPSIPPAPGLDMARGYFWTVSSVAITLFVTIGVIISKAITSREKKEHELAQAKDYTDSIIESMIDTLIVVDPEAKIKTINKATSELLGYKEDELVGRSVTTIFEEEEEPFNGTRMKKLIEEGSLRDYDMTYKTKADEKIPVSFYGSVMRDGKGEVTGVVGIARDMREIKRLMQKEKELAAAAVTAAAADRKRAAELEIAYKDLEKANKELKETTAQLVQSEKMSALGELTAGIAHELNQPLNVTKIICQSILRDAQRGRYDKEGVEEDLPEIVKQVNKMAEIIDHMRIFTRRTEEGMSMKTVDVNTTIEGAFKFLGQQLKDRNIEVIKELSPDLPKVTADPIRLEQAFLNLITNARDAVERSGKKDKRIEIRTYKVPGQQAVAVDIKDNDGGIPEDLRGKIFHPFFTTKKPGAGTGLGLSVTNKIIEEHKGRIELESKVGEEAIFRVILPVSKL